MVGKTVVSPEQMEILVSFMEEHREFGRGQINGNGPLAKKMSAAKWAKLASRLNSVTGTNKSPRKWREYWNDKKYSVRKKSSSITNGGSSKRTLDEMDLRILDVVGKVAVYSEESVRIPNPFDDGETIVEFVIVNMWWQWWRFVHVHESYMYQDTPLDSIVHSGGANSFDNVAPDGNKKKVTIPLKRRRYIRSTSYAPEWAIQIEARRVRAEERSAAAFEILAASTSTLSDSLAGIRQELGHIRTMLERRQNNY